MPLFRHRPGPPVPRQPAGVPGLAAAAAAQGWQPAGAQPFGPDLGRDIHEITRIMYGVPRGGAMTNSYAVGDTVFADAFRGSFGGRTVTVANAWTYIEPGLMNIPDHRGVVAVCAVELPSILLLLCIQPRRFDPVAPRSLDQQTGDPAFDGQFSVAGAPGLPCTAQQVLTPDVQQRIMARDDWIFRAEGYQLCCISKGTFGSTGEISQRVAEVMGIVTAIPESVLPRQVDHSADDLAARISQLDSIEDALAFLQQLTPADRERLARSGTPLAAFADVRSPEEAMARFESLDPSRKMQLLAMFMRVEDERGLR